MPTVFLCSPTNSTMFTTCCEVAITDEQIFCPSCRRDVVPHSRNERWDAAYGPIKRRHEGYGNRWPNHGLDWKPDIQMVYDD